jgi:hypothetical protein
VRNYNCQKSFGALFVFAAMFLPGTAAAEDTQIGKLGAVSPGPSASKSETKTADDFMLKQTSVLTGASITGLMLPVARLRNIANIKVELYHFFPEDSVDPPSANVPSRVLSPANVGIDSATRWYALGINAIFTLGLIGAGLTGNRKTSFRPTTDAPVRQKSDSGTTRSPSMTWETSCAARTSAAVCPIPDTHD